MKLCRNSMNHEKSSEKLRKVLRKPKKIFVAWRFAMSVYDYMLQKGLWRRLRQGPLRSADSADHFPAAAAGPRAAAALLRRSGTFEASVSLQTTSASFCKVANPTSFRTKQHFRREVCNLHRKTNIDSIPVVGDPYEYSVQIVVHGYHMSLSN